MERNEIIKTVCEIMNIFKKKESELSVISREMFEYKRNICDWCNNKCEFIKEFKHEEMLVHYNYIKNNFINRYDFYEIMKTKHIQFCGIKIPLYNRNISEECNYLIWRTSQVCKNENKKWIGAVCGDEGVYIIALIYLNYIVSNFIRSEYNDYVDILNKIVKDIGGYENLKICRYFNHDKL